MVKDYDQSLNSWVDVETTSLRDRVNEQFKVGSVGVVTFIKDAKHIFLVSIQDVAMLYNNQVSSLTKLIKDSDYILDGEDRYITHAGFLKVESELVIIGGKKAIDARAAKSKVFRWIGNGCKFSDDDSTYKASSDPAYHKEIWHNVIDLAEWEREMLLLILDVNDHGLRKKLATKIKEVL